MGSVEDDTALQRLSSDTKYTDIPNWHWRWESVWSHSWCWVVSRIGQHGHEDANTQADRQGSEDERRGGREVNRSTTLEDKHGVISR